MAAASAAPSPQQQAYNYETPAPPVSYTFDWAVNSVDNLQRPVNYGHQEQRQGAATQGVYFVLLPDSRLMRVNYYADETGFHPTYTFEQPPVQSQAVASPPGAYTPPGK